MNGDNEMSKVDSVIKLATLGDEGFKKLFGTRYTLMGGAMAGGISSVEMTVAMGKAGMLCSFGAGGLILARIAEAIGSIQAGLPSGPYAFNLLHSPNEERLEKETVDLYLHHKINVVEAAAYLRLTPHVVRYRAKGIALINNKIVVKNKVIAKVSRPEIATLFFMPPPESILQKLSHDQLITPQQAELAAKIPMADCVTVEADSGGHTDGQSFLALFPIILRLRDTIQRQCGNRVLVGAAGGIGTPEAMFGAYMMGADYAVTGSVNHACVESGTSDYVKKLLATVGINDVTMAPAVDMFEAGIELQVVKKGTLFPMRGKKLYNLYVTYDSIDDIPAKEREKIEKEIFRDSLENVWVKTQDFFSLRDPAQIEKAVNNPKRKMALIFRSYLGQSSDWATQGLQGREMDYQIYSGPALGSFNDWTKDTYLAMWNKRLVVDVNLHLLQGSSWYYQKLISGRINNSIARYYPQSSLS